MRHSLIVTLRLDTCLYQIVTEEPWLFESTAAAHDRAARADGRMPYKLFASLL